MPNLLEFASTEMTEEEGRKSGPELTVRPRRAQTRSEDGVRQV